MSDEDRLSAAWSRAAAEELNRLRARVADLESAAKRLPLTVLEQTEVPEEVTASPDVAWVQGYNHAIRVLNDVLLALGGDDR